MTFKQLGLPILVTGVLLLLLSVPYLPTNEIREVSETHTIRVTTAAFSARTWHADGCSKSLCPILDKSSAVLKGYSTLALDVVVINPTDLQVYNLAVRFNYWGPYTCPTCLPDYNTLIMFDALPPGTRQSKHVEILNTQLFRQQIFRYAFQIETFESQTYFPITFSSTTTSLTSLTFGGSVAIYQLIRHGEPMESVGILGAAGVATFLCTILLSRRLGLVGRRRRRTTFDQPKRVSSVSRDLSQPLSRPTGPSNHEASLALDSEFRIYRDRLQESLFAGKIDEREYARLLAEFPKSKK